MKPNRLSGNLAPPWGVCYFVIVDMRQDAHFEHFGGLGPYIARMSVRRPIFSMLGAGPRYCQNDVQDARFKHFGGLAPDIARMGF